MTQQAQRIDQISASGPWRDEQLAAAALLVNAARLDGYFSPQELQAVQSGLQNYFGLSEAAAIALMNECQKTPQIMNFQPIMAVLRERLDEEQRRELAQMVREVVYSDGSLDPLEAHLLQSITRLLNIPDDDSETSRQRALDALGITRKMVRKIS